MSSLPRRVMHDEGSYAAAAIHHHGSHASHAGHAQASVTDLCAPCPFPCPYEAKVVADGTTARMVLMFLRELVEQPVYHPQLQQQTYVCPMMKCYEKFMEPFHLVQHLLSCPELPNGEFDCDKCNNWHEFPTNEKDWSQWAGWSWKAQRQNPQAHPGPGDNIQRKRSLGSKVRDTFTLRKKDSRKTTSSSENHGFSSDTRPGTATSCASSVMTMSRCPHEHPQHPAFPAQANPVSFADLPKASSLVPASAPQIEGGIFWPSLGGDPMSDLQSAVSSIAPSFDDATTKSISTTNTSQTTLFNSALAPFQSPTTDVLTPQYMFSPQGAFDNVSTPLGAPAHPSAMSIDEPLPVSEAAISPTDMRPATPTDRRTWWGVKPDIDTPRPTPVSSPFYGIEQAMTHHPMSRAISHESMQASMTGLYQRTLSEGTSMETLSPHAEHSHHAHVPPGATMARPGSPTEELVCDECQWKPRGVRENLRGYLRKHKNTHKGLRLPCDVAGCTKTFSRLDNLKKHKKDKHGIEEPGTIVPLKRVAEEYAEQMEEDVTTPTEPRRIAGLSEADIRNASGDYSMLWPALHF